MNAFIGRELVGNLGINCCKNIFCRSYQLYLPVFTNCVFAIPDVAKMTDDWPVNVRQVLDGDLLLPVGLLHAGLEEVLVVLDGVVPEQSNASLSFCKFREI